MTFEESALSHSLAAVEWPGIVQALGDRVVTPYGKTAHGSMAFLNGLEAIRESLARIQEMRTLIEERGPVGFGGIHPIAELLERAEKAGRLEIAELVDVLSTQRRILAVGEALLQPDQAPRLRQLAAAVHREDDLIATLDAAITPAGDLNERAFPELGNLRRQIVEGREAIHRHLDGILRSKPLEPVLQDKVVTLRGHRYVVPVKADFKGQLPGIVHDVSASGATLFVEPQAIVDETNALTLVEKQLDIELDRILRELSGKVGYSASSLRHNTAWAGDVDLLHAQALLSRDMHASAPLVEAQCDIELKGLAHPLMVLANEEVVRNDVRLGPDAHCLIISGANTGGKTVLLKAVGLCALLVRAGMHVPAAAGSRMDWFPDFWADIGDRQDMRMSLSTFSAQVRFLGRILNSAGEGSLVLLDELMTGTEPVEGAALARQVLEALTAQGAKLIVTTHYGELKLLADQIPGVINGSVSFDDDRLRPTYRFTLGVPGASYALPIASRNGLPENLVRRAEESLAGHPAALDALLRQLHAQEQRLFAEQSQLERRQSQLQRREAELERRAKQLSELQAQLRRQERGALSDDLLAARRQIAAVISELQGANSLPIAGRVRDKLRELEAEHLKPAPLPASVAQSAPPAIGETVYVASLERTGELREVVDDGATACIQFGQLTLEVPFAQVLPATAAPVHVPSRSTRRQPQTRGLRHSAGNAEPAPEIPHVFQTSENTLDVRGHSLEDATAQAEAFFDQSMVKHVNPVLVIHGHGTGRLKSGLREHFRGSRYVAGFRPGGPGEGLDGVTVVALNL